MIMIACDAEARVATAATINSLEIFIVGPFKFHRADSALNLSYDHRIYYSKAFSELNEGRAKFYRSLIIPRENTGQVLLTWSLSTRKQD
jgi:hypothetical protein